MNRRTFIHAASAAGATGLGLSSRLGLAGSDGSVARLLTLLEDAPRERVPRELVRMIRAGLRYENLLAALTLAAVRNVQPYPDVGFKYHSVLVLRAIHAATRQLSAADRWLPIVWAADYFKECQAQERDAGEWRLPARPAVSIGNPQGARRALIDALDRWDRDAADAAVVAYASVATPDEVFSLLFPYGARDLREIGHKSITVSNAHSLVGLLGSAWAEPILRSTVAALQNSGGDPSPASHDLEPDRPWRQNQPRLQRIAPNWRQGRDDPGARTELRAALYRVSPEEAGALVVDLLRQGIGADALWRVLFSTAAELLMRQPGIVPLHAHTTANALHYAYRMCGEDGTRRLLLLQCAAFVAMFGKFGTGAQDINLAELQPAPLGGRSGDALDEIFSELSSGGRLQAARKSLGYLQGGGDAGALIARARRHVVLNASEAHDYKFAEAVFDNQAQVPDAAWRIRYLSAGMAYFKAPANRPGPVVVETLELLGG